MEKIFDIAKDSEKSWGIIAQGIDGNFEEVNSEIDGVINKNVYQSTRKRIAIFLLIPDTYHPMFLNISSVNPPVQNFIIYYSKDDSGKDVVLYKNKQNFDTDIKIERNEEYPYLYIYNTGIKDGTIDAVDYTVTWKTEGSIKGDIEALGLKDKNIVVFGDSISENRGTDGLSYSDHIQTIYRANVYNVGIGGSQLRQRTNPVEIPTSANQCYAALDTVNMVKAACTGNFTMQENAADYLKENNSDDNTNIINRLKNIEWNSIDAVIVFAGTNDWINANTRLGESNSTNVNTTLGAINVIIQTLLSTYPRLKLYWFTPIVRWVSATFEGRTDENWSDSHIPSPGDKNLAEYSNVIFEEVKKNHIPVCDMYWGLGWNKYNFSQYFTDTDGTHPSKGYKEIAKKIASFLIANKTF